MMTVKSDSNLINLNAPCPCCKGNGLHPIQIENCSDEELKDCPVCGGCGDMSIAVEAMIDRLAKGSIPHSHFICQGFAARMIAKAERIHARIKGQESGSIESQGALPFSAPQSADEELESLRRSQATLEKIFAECGAAGFDGSTTLIEFIKTRISPQ